jgi:glycosyltransferase involved in cell wall biosynthesis
LFSAENGLIYRKTDSHIANIIRYLTLMSHKSKYIEQVSMRASPLIEIAINNLWVPLLENTLGKEYLIWACQHILPPVTKLQWIGDFEHGAAICAYGDPKLYRNYIKKCILSKKCIAMIAWSEKAKNNIEKLINTKLHDKVRVIYPAVPIISELEKDEMKNCINLIHVGTWRDTVIENYANFLVKGTRDTLMVSKKLLEKFKNRIKIKIRAYVPKHIESYFKGNFGERIEFISRTLPRKEIFATYQESDILLLPCHSTPTRAFIEAMSCGLPIVTTNVWANKELLEDAKFAMIVDPPGHVKYEDEFGTPLWYRSEFMRKIERIDSNFIHALFDSISYLIENENLLIKFKKESLSYFKERFSVKKRNAQLEEVLRSW